MEEEDMNCTSGKNKLKTILNSHKIGEYTTEEETAFMTDFFRLYHPDWYDKNQVLSLTCKKYEKHIQNYR